MVHSCRFPFQGVETRYKLRPSWGFARYVWVFLVRVREQCRGPFGVPRGVPGKVGGLGQGGLRGGREGSFQTGGPAKNSALGRIPLTRALQSA